MYVFFTLNPCKTVRSPTYLKSYLVHDVHAMDAPLTESPAYRAYTCPAEHNQGSGRHTSCRQSIFKSALSVTLLPARDYFM